MRILQSLTVFLFIAFTTYAAQVKISDLPLNVSPTDATYIEIADMGASPKSGKYLLSNLVERAHIPTSGLFKGNGGLGATAAVAGTDYVQPGSIIGNGFTMPTSRLLGRTTAGTGDIEPITVGTGLTLSGGVLEATGGGGGGGTWGSITGDINDQTDLIGLFNLKAPVASPTFTGTAVFDIIEANELTLEYAEFGEMTVTTNMYLPYLVNTNKLVGTGTSTNLVNGTYRMWTNTAGIFTGSTTDFLRADGTMAAPAAGGITGSDTQVLFFDGANNPAGDAGFTYNKTTDSATLAGDLTVANEAYDASGWNGDLTVPTKDALRDKIEALPSDTATFTGKTYDTAGTGNVFKQTKYLTFVRPDYGDGAGAVPQTNSYTVSGLMHYTFSGSAETNVNYVVYEGTVPPDIDTSVAMTATFAFVSGGSDADDVTFHATYALGAAGTALPTGTSIATSPIALTVTPTTPASGDVQTTAAVTLTGWAGSMTAGTPLFIRLARLNNSNDDTARDLYLRIAYGSTQ